MHNTYFRTHNKLYKVRFDLGHPVLRRLLEHFLKDRISVPETSAFDTLKSFQFSLFLMFTLC